MKKIIAFIFAVIIMITVCGCGNVSKADIMLTPSQRYSEKELTTAANITKTYFMMNYDGCTLNYISYNDDVNEKNREDHGQHACQRNCLPQKALPVSLCDTDQKEYCNCYR